MSEKNLHAKPPYVWRFLDGDVPINDGFVGEKVVCIIKSRHC